MSEQKYGRITQRISVLLIITFAVAKKALIKDICRAFPSAKKTRISAIVQHHYHKNMISQCLMVANRY